jgi:NADH:ubiquinone oxidoreductase subunit D
MQHCVRTILTTFYHMHHYLRGHGQEFHYRAKRSAQFMVPLGPEEVGQDFRGMHIELSRIICNVLFLLTQPVDLGCVGVYCSLWQTRSN